MLELCWIQSGHSMVTAWRRLAWILDWCGLVEIGDHGGMGLVWRLVGSLGYLMVVLLGLGVVCGFVSGSVEGFNGDFFKIGLLGLLGFGLV